MSPEKELRMEMTRLVAESHGQGLVPEFYDAEAAEFIEWAEWYAGQKVKEFKESIGYNLATNHNHKVLDDRTP